MYLIKFLNGKILLFFSFRKYVQVCVQNLSELDFQLSDSHLVDTGDSTDLRLIPLNTESEQVTVSESRAQTSRQNAEESKSVVMLMEVTVCFS